MQSSKVFEGWQKYNGETLIPNFHILLIDEKHIVYINNLQKIKINDQYLLINENKTIKDYIKENGDILNEQGDVIYKITGIREQGFVGKTSVL